MAVKLNWKYPSQRKRYLKKREFLIAQAIIRQKRNPEKTKATVKRYWYSHRDELLRKKRARSIANLERDKQSLRKYRQSEKGKLVRTASDHRRRVNKIGNVTARQLAAIKKQSGGKCFYCGQVRPKLTFDHIIPISSGGFHSIDNIVCACSSCNSRKHVRPSHVFLKEFGRLL